MHLAADQPPMGGVTRPFSALEGRATSAYLRQCSSARPWVSALLTVFLSSSELISHRCLPELHDFCAVLVLLLVWMAYWSVCVCVCLRGVLSTRVVALTRNPWSRVSSPMQVIAPVAKTKERKSVPQPILRFARWIRLRRIDIDGNVYGYPLPPCCSWSTLVARTSEYSYTRQSGM